MVEIPSFAYANTMIDDPAALIYATETDKVYLNFKEPEPVLKLGQAYAWQVQVFDPAGEMTFENDGFSEVRSFRIKEAQLPAPEIITPAEEELITVARPFSLEIDWEHSVSPDLPVTYELGVWPFEEGSSFSTIIRDKAPILVEQGIAETTFTTSNELLEGGGKFFVRVIASSTDEDVEFMRSGRSDFQVFEVEKTVTNHVLNLACGEGCRYELPTNTEPVSLFGSGDTVRMGNFLLRLTDATQLSGDTYSGEAEIIPGSFFKAPIKVDLRSVRFNQAGIAVGGLAEAVPAEEVGLPGAWTSTLGALRLPPDPQGVAQRLDAQSRSVRAASERTRTLPLEFNGVYLTYLRLLPTTATANVVNLQEFSGDRQVGSQYGLFIKRGVCFSAGGPAVSEAEAFLPLVNEVTIDRSAAYTMTLLRRASDAPYGGTALPFNCEETTPEVHLAGYVTLRQDGLLQDGQPLASAPVYASFRATYENWLDWQAELHVRTVGNRSSCCNDFMEATITYAQLPDYQLEIETMFLDHSTASNPDGLRLPAGHNGPNGELLDQFPGLVTLWNGIYLKDAKWKLPAFVSKTNGQRVSFPANNVIIDDLGLSAQSAFATDEFGPQITLKDWTGRVVGSNIDVQGNELEATNLKLTARIPAFEASVPITGEASWTNNRSIWSFSLPDIQGLERRIPAWSANLRLNRYKSVMVGALNNARDELSLNLGLYGVLDFDDRIGDIEGIRLRGLEVQNLIVNNWNTEWNREHPIYVSSIKTSHLSLYKIAGYRVFIDAVKATSVSGDEMSLPGSKLTLKYHFNFDDLASLGRQGISAEGALNIMTEAAGTPVTRLRQRAAWLKRVDLDWAPMDGIFG
ncbi:MAG: hypothetical protein AAF597_05695, partial [Bacteroidota bacterium]